MAAKDKGRPSKYTDKLAKEICFRMACGDSVRKICESEDMPSKSTVMLWVAENRGANEEGNGGFSDQYARAAQAKLFHHADELLDIADDGSNDWMMKYGDGDVGYTVNGEHIQRSRVRIDTRKWLLSKLVPKYADKKEIEHSGALKVSSIVRKTI